MQKQLSHLVLLFLFSFQVCYSQNSLPKQPGRITKDEIKRAYENGRARKPHLVLEKSKVNATMPDPVSNGTGACSCDIPLDGSFSYAILDGDSGYFGGFPCSGCPGLPPDYRNDDSYTSTTIKLPFSFCFYGTSYNEVYINNNGNISFSDFYSEFSPSPFPIYDTAMIAPFWADVDTRALGSGVVHYKLTSTALIVKWDGVGYYDSLDDLLNTFQLIITNGSDPLVPNGNNVSFCYKDMQWTTGEASGGFGGFGGAPATVGANKGDGTHYIQFGTFDKQGSSYNGPYGSPSGIDWLDNQVFNFNVCTGGNNIPPSPSGLATCDTIRLCTGDTLNLPSQFFSPEIGQTTSVVITTTPGLLGWQVFSNTPGNPATISARLIAKAGNSGFYTITFTATDNGFPPATTISTLVIFINDPATCGNILHSNFISSDSTFCDEGGGCADFTDHSTGSPSSWEWHFPGAVPDSSSQQNPTNICYYSPGTYTVTLITKIGNARDTLTISPMISVGFPSAPIISFSGDTLICSHASSYQWYFNGAPIPGAIDSFYIATIPGNYSVQIMDEFGCSKSSTGVWASLAGINNGSGLIVYPNPAKDELWVESYGLWVGKAKVEISNVLGENVYRTQLTTQNLSAAQAGTKLTATIDVTSLAKGVYIVELNTGEKVFRAKFVKKD